MVQTEAMFTAHTRYMAFLWPLAPIDSVLKTQLGVYINSNCTVLEQQGNKGHSLTLL